MDRVEDAVATAETFDEPAEGALEPILRGGRMLASDRPEAHDGAVLGARGAVGG